MGGRVRCLAHRQHTAHLAPLDRVLCDGGAGVSRRRSRRSKGQPRFHSPIWFSSSQSSPQRTPSYVRLYRDYSIADLSFCGLFAVFTALASFRPGARTCVCEALARQPELLRDLAEAGLNSENCEQWFIHAVVALLGVTAVLLVVRVRVETSSCIGSSH